MSPRHPTASSGGEATRVAVMILLLLAAAALLVFQAGYRHLEALLASWVFAGGGVRTFTGTDDVVVFMLPDTRAFALQVTPECTSAFLIAPFAVIGAAMLLRRRIDPLRVLLGVSIAALLLVLANQLRLGVIAGLVTSWGLDQGYQWGHLVIGSLISVVFLAISASIVLLVVASGHGGRHEAVTP